MQACLLAASLLMTSTTFAAPPAPLNLWSDPIPGRIDDGESEVTTRRGDIERVAHVHVPQLFPYLCPPQRNSGAAVVICPGGGYGIIAIEHEGYDVAQWFNSFGVNAFVLKYRMSPYRHPIPLMDAQQALRLVRSHAKEWGIDPNRLGVMGFSAGGHLASTVATHYAKPVATEGPLAEVSCRPDFQILGYPVISFVDPELTHRGSRRNLLGEVDDPALFESLSAERQVTKDSPPAFCFHAKDDRGVPPGNSLALQKALQAKGVAAEVFLLESGGHGFGMRRREWTRPCARWLVAQGFVAEKFLDGAAPQADLSLVPGVVIDHSPASSGLYIGSPSLAILPDGSYLASHDLFGPKSNEKQSGKTRVFRSAEDGRTWSQVGALEGMFWGTLFVHRGAAYLIGSSAQYGNAVIRKSTDGGKTWTAAVDENSGVLLGDGQYHCAPQPVLLHRGRLWRALEDSRGGKGWGKHFRSFMLSAPEDADLLQASSWTVSNRIARDPSWLDGRFGGWLEGNAVAAPTGEVVNILRVDDRQVGGQAAVIHLSADGRTATFDPTTGFIDFPGANTKFTIRYDEREKCYWSVVNYVPPQFEGRNKGSTRNTLALTRSKDLRHWEVRSILLFHPDPLKHAFQYCDWQFDPAHPDDLLVVARTAFDDGLGGAHNFHDANFMTFHRVANFRTLTREDDCPEFRQYVATH